MNPVIYTYKEENKVSRKLSEALNCPRHWPGTGYEYQEGDLIVNWGNGSPMGVPQTANILNKYKAVLRSVNKGVSFEHFRNAGVSIPANTTQREIAADWIRRGEIVFCRQTLEGCNGAGIVVSSTIDELVHAPMYTKYVHNDREFRVHVFKGEAIFWTEKGIARDAGPNPDPMIKSGNDWSMCWVDEIPEEVKNQAIKATAALGLDFAAIDIGYKTGVDAYDETCQYEVAWVFESNTAPGAFGPVTLRKYLEAIRRACE